LAKYAEIIADADGILDIPTSRRQLVIFGYKRGPHWEAFVCTQ